MHGILGDLFVTFYIKLLRIETTVKSLLLRLANVISSFCPPDLKMRLRRCANRGNTIAVEFRMNIHNFAPSGVRGLLL